MTTMTEITAPAARLLTVEELGILSNALDVYRIYCQEYARADAEYWAKRITGIEALLAESENLMCLRMAPRE